MTYRIPEGGDPFSRAVAGLRLAETIKEVPMNGRRVTLSTQTGAAFQSDVTRIYDEMSHTEELFRCGGEQDPEVAKSIERVMNRRMNRPEGFRSGGRLAILGHGLVEVMQKPSAPNDQLEVLPLDGLHSIIGKAAMVHCDIYPVANSIFQMLPDENGSFAGSKNHGPVLRLEDALVCSTADEGAVEMVLETAIVGLASPDLQVHEVLGMN